MEDPKSARMRNFDPRSALRPRSTLPVLNFETSVQGMKNFEHMRKLAVVQLTRLGKPFLGHCL
jgi:hypothetical protein